MIAAEIEQAPDNERWLALGLYTTTNFSNRSRPIKILSTQTPEITYRKVSFIRDVDDIQSLFEQISPR